MYLSTLLLVSQSCDACTTTVSIYDSRDVAAWFASLFSKCSWRTHHGLRSRSLMDKDIKEDLHRHTGISSLCRVQHSDENSKVEGRYIKTVEDNSTTDVDSLPRPVIALL